MFDVYQNGSDPMERVLVVHCSSLPPSFPEKEWKLLGSMSSVNEDIKSYVMKQGFYVYRTSAEFKENGVLRI